VKSDETVQNAKERLDKSAASCEEAEGKLKEVAQKLETLNARHQENRSAMDIAKERLGQRERALQNAARALTETRKEAETLEGELSMARKELLALNNEMRKRKADRATKEEERKAKRTELKKRLEDIKAEETGKEQQLDEARKRQEEREELKRQRHFACRAADVEKRSHSGRLAELERELGEAQARDARHLGRFGPGMEDLVEDVERFAGRFERPPIGPVGRHIHLKGKAASDQNLADLLQIELGFKTLTTFLVGSERDYRALVGLIEKNKEKLRNPPRVCIMNLSGGKRYDISKGRANTDEAMPGVLDFLTFEKDDVFNYVCNCHASY